MAIDRPSCNICGVKFYDMSHKGQWRIMHRRNVPDLKHPKDFKGYTGLYCPKCLSKSKHYTENNA